MSQYAYRKKNNPNNYSCNKKGDKNGKKGDNAKFEYKGNINTGTAGAYVWEAALGQDNTIKYWSTRL